MRPLGKSSEGYGKKRFTFSFPYPVLPWRLIALLALALVLFIFLWMIFFGPLSRCDRLWQNFADKKVFVTPSSHFTKHDLIYDELKAHGCLKYLKDD